MQRTYCLNASRGELLGALRGSVLRGQLGRIDRQVADVLELQSDGDRFTLSLGPPGAARSAARLRGQLSDDGALTRLVTTPVRVTLRPGNIRELLDWALVIGGLVALAVALGITSGSQALGGLLRWSLAFVALVLARLVHRLIRRRRDQAELHSLIEGAVGPYLALPAGAPFRSPALRTSAVQSAAPLPSPATPGS